MFRRAARALVAVAAAALLVIAGNTLRQRSRQVDVARRAPPGVDVNGAATRLAGAVRLATISYDAPSADSYRQLLALHAYLQQAFPKLHLSLRREVVNGYSLLYTWTGRNAAAPPILLMAHQDVVPVAADSESRWQVPPFAGQISDGYVWGRGAWDDKGNLLAILEAVEALVARGFQPERTVYLAFGHDEENGGQEGAGAIARLLAQRGVKPEFVLDEGTLIAEGMMPGLDPPAAVIGVAEKGSATLQLTVAGVPGHSSMPAGPSAIGTLASALQRIETHPLPARIDGAAADMLDTLAPEMHGSARVLLSNRWLFGPLVRRALERSPATNAMLRTTAAITVLRAGDKENVLPAQAVALVNIRLLPGDTVAGTVAQLRRVIRDDRVRIDVRPGGSAATPVASHDAPGYRLICRTVRELFPGVVVTPGLMIGATDSRYMVPLARNVYRFSPVRAHAEDLMRFHGVNERISVANYAELIQFYQSLIGHAAGPERAARPERAAGQSRSAAQ